MNTLELQVSKQVILKDYALAIESREDSLIGRKEVFMGKAKFGIFGDGKELPQIAMAHAFKKGDFRSGYYRDQTFMMAIGELTSKQFFAQLYAHTDVSAEPASAGRQMNGHFATRSLDQNGKWNNLTEIKNSSSDISPTAGQMPRLLGLAYASKLYRNNPDLHKFTQFSIIGNEVAFGTIGNAATSEGHFFETMNAAGVLQVPMVMAVWDDDYGISVSAEYHTTKQSISKALEGMKRSLLENGIEIFTVKGWDYLHLIETFSKAAELARNEHVPVLVHVTEITQPQGHSTSGSHERYKSKDRLLWESEFDCIKKMKEWILIEGIATVEEIEEIENEAKKAAKDARSTAWEEFMKEINLDKQLTLDVLKKFESVEAIKTIIHELTHLVNPLKSDVFKTIRKALVSTRHIPINDRSELIQWHVALKTKYNNQFSSHLYSQSSESVLNIHSNPPYYSDEPKLVDGREILQACFDAAFSREPRLFAIGEDVGKIGDVNQGMAGLQAKFGEIRITDTGIRELTIMGQGIGAAMRGLRPIAEIQYLDYLIYAIQTLSDDLATLQYRTCGGQKAPVIIRTRGHRLEGVWHSGSPIGMILSTIRGIYVCVPRNMTQAAGFYNSFLQSDDPVIIIEPLNGYRLKEKLPENIGTFTVPVGIPDILKEGNDITIVTYGSMCRIVLESANQLELLGISVEIIDVQTLIPFDIQSIILESLKKTNRIIFADEDVPGGASAYMMHQVLEVQGGYFYLDSKPVCITSKEHRPAYGSDGDYFSKPSVEDVIETVYQVMSEVNATKFPTLY